MEEYMKSLSVLISSVILLILVNSTHAQKNSSGELIKEGIAKTKLAYLHYDNNLLNDAYNIFDKAYSSDSTNMLPAYYLALIDYKFCEMNARQGSESLFDKYYNDALAKIKKLETNKNFEADGKIITAGVYMMKITISPMSAVTLSSKVHALLDEAQGIDPSNPYSYLIRGIMDLNTPEMYGGSPSNALKNFNTSLRLFGENDSTLIPWGDVETLAWTGQALEKLGNLESAEFTYKKSLKEEPDFMWVKQSLLPNLEAKLANR